MRYGFSGKAVLVLGLPHEDLRRGATGARLLRSRSTHRAFRLQAIFLFIMKSQLLMKRQHKKHYSKLKKA